MPFLGDFGGALQELVVELAEFQARGPIVEDYDGGDDLEGCGPSQPRRLKLERSAVPPELCPPADLVGFQKRTKLAFVVCEGNK
jgi:hypothetical protein